MRGGEVWAGGVGYGPELIQVWIVDRGDKHADTPEALPTCLGPDRSREGPAGAEPGIDVACVLAGPQMQHGGLRHTSRPLPELPRKVAPLAPPGGEQPQVPARNQADARVTVSSCARRNDAHSSEVITGRIGPDAYALERAPSPVSGSSRDIDRVRARDGRPQATVRCPDERRLADWPQCHQAGPDCFARADPDGAGPGWQRWAT